MVKTPRMEFFNVSDETSAVCRCQSLRRSWHQVNSQFVHVGRIECFYHLLSTISDHCSYWLSIPGSSNFIRLSKAAFIDVRWTFLFRINASGWRQERRPKNKRSGCQLCQSIRAPKNEWFRGALTDVPCLAKQTRCQQKIAETQQS